MNIRKLSRKQFLRGNIRQKALLRPPWAIPETDFTEKCSRCYLCAQACPSHLIVKAQGGFPEISFSRHGCDYCEACVRACPEGALFLSDENPYSAWQQRAHISDACLTLKNIVCRSCGEVCETLAIKFVPGVKGVYRVNINQDTCTGCGECVHVCPTNAIDVKRLNQE